MATPHEDAGPYDLMSQAFLADPSPTFRRMREEDPVHWHSQLGAWVLTRSDDIVGIDRDRRFSADRLGYFEAASPPHMREEMRVCNRFLSTWPVFNDPPRHTALRSLIAQAFTSKMMEDLQPFIEQVVDDVLDSVIASGKMDVVADLATPLPAVVIGKMLGVPNADLGRFKGWTNDVFALFSAPQITEDVLRAAHHGTVELLRYFRDLIAERRAAPGADVLSRLIGAEEKGQVLTDEEMVAMCAFILVAGHETTTHLIGNSILALLKNPAELDKLRAHPELVDGAVDELARYDGAIWMVPRLATQDVEIRGKRIEAGQVLLLSFLAGSHDPARCADPDRLDVSRKAPPSLAFGTGPHYCLGASLARMEVRVALHRILDRLSDLRLAETSLVWIPSMLIRGVISLPVTFKAPETARESLPGVDVELRPSVPPPSIPPPSLRNLDLPKSIPPPSMPASSRRFGQ